MIAKNTLSATTLDSQFATFLEVSGIDAYPICVQESGHLAYGDSFSEIEHPKPITECEEAEVIRYTKLPARQAISIVPPPPGEVEEHTYGERFVKTWSDVGSALEEANKRHSLISTTRFDYLDSFVSGIEGKGFQYAARAMIAEHEAAKYAARAEIEERADSESAVLWMKGKSLDGMRTAATAWLNFIRHEGIYDGFGRHIISHATLYGCYGECWHVSRLLFQLSAELYMKGEMFDESAKDQVRAAYVHSRKAPYSSQIVANHIASAIDCWRKVLPTPPEEIISAAIALQKSAIRIGGIVTPDGDCDS